MRLALFDLDHTLLPFDSGMAWMRFLVERGTLPPATEADYLQRCKAYVAGEMGIESLHRAIVAPLARVPPVELDRWRHDFERRVRPQAAAGTRALVQRHLDAGDLCALVTATSRLIAEPCARVFGLVHVIATEPVVAHGAYTGEIDGLPCVGVHKPARVAQWLAEGAPPGTPRELRGFEQSWFYSDAASDLPLLRAVSHAVAVSPDERLLAAAEKAGWPILLADRSA